MELPVVALDVGAQAERVRAYPYGVVAPDARPETLLACLEQAIRSKRPGVEEAAAAYADGLDQTTRLTTSM